MDLPDDMFESAAALNAAEEEKERERREANQRQRRQAALEAADSLDSLGDSMDVDDATIPTTMPSSLVDVDDETMDVPEEGTGDSSSPTGEIAPPSDPENLASCGIMVGADEDTADPDDPDDPGEIHEGTGDIPVDADEVGGLGDIETAAEDPDDPGVLSTETKDLDDITAGPNESGDPDDPPEPPDASDEPPTASRKRDPAADLDPDDPPVASRKRPCSPVAGEETNKARRVETGRPFIEVKKVQLSENNLRILQVG